MCLTLYVYYPCIVSLLELLKLTYLSRSAFAVGSLRALNQTNKPRGALLVASLRPHDLDRDLPLAQ